MAYLLTAFGHEVLEAHDGIEGIERARREKPDLILLDIHMPQMDGYEAALRLGKMPECYGVPIVAVTALAMVGDREKIMTSGFNGYIAKPIDPEAFAAQVQRHLETAHSAIPSRAMPSQQPDRPPGSSPGKKLAVVLFVDNMQTNIDLVRSVLEPSGYELFTALSAKDGFDLAQRTEPDLILSDVHMPHQDGYEFLRMVQADARLSKIPFMFLSNSVWSSRDREQARLRGAKFISRPIEPELFLSQLRNCLLNK